MVCKEDVVSWFKNLKSHTRIDVMCNLFNLCLPFELRFLGTCLEDLGKRDFHDLRTTETGANNPSELSSPDLQCISDKHARTKLALYISLLHSCNYACSNGYYKILANVEEVNNLIKCNGVCSADDDVLEELLLIYTLALNHPAFTFDQKLFLGNVFTKLQEEEVRRSLRRARSSQGITPMDAVEKLPMQAFQPCASPEQLPLVPPANVACTPMTPAALTGDPLVSMQDPLVGYLPFSLMGYHPAAMMLPPPPHEQRSPMVSRTGSPCQSTSPSRAGSPRTSQPPPTFTRPPPTLDKTKHLNLEQLRGLTDEELRENGFNNQSISQLRSLPNTNGYNLGGKKMLPAEPEPQCDVGVNSGGPLRRYNSADGPLNPPPLYYNVNCSPHCMECFRNRAPPKMPLVAHVKSLSLDPDTGSLQNSSGSDSASDRDHSPPETPDTRLTATPDRVAGPGLMEAWEEQQRISEAVEERRAGLGVGRGRGNGRNRALAVHTLPRGRGHNPAQRRRDANAANGAIEDRKVFSNDTGGGGLAYPYTAQFLPPNFIQAYPFSHSGGVFRLPFHHLNGEMLYHPLPPPTAQPFLPTRPTPPPPHLSFSPLVPPPKISCYNCGSQSHIGTECPEATIEEITNKGQYRIDYTSNLTFPVNKPGECSTAQDK